MAIIRETENYTLSTGSPVDPKDVYRELYLVTNKKYGIVEVETTMLPSAIKYLHDLEAGLAAVNDMFEEPNKEIPKIHTGRSKLQ